MLAHDRFDQQGTDRSRRTNFAKFAIGDDERPEGTEAIQCLIAMLLRLRLVDGGTRFSSIAASDLLAVPDEVLQKIALVLGQEQNLRLLDCRTKVSNKVLAFARELRRGASQRPMCESAVESNVDLFVLRQLRQHFLRLVQSRAAGEVGDAYRRHLAVGKSCVMECQF